MRNSKKRNYPKTRKKRETSYSETYRLIQEHGLETIHKIWIKTGMYRTGYELGTSPYIIRYMAQKYGWKRPAELVPVLLKGVQAGNMPADHYKTLDFSNIKPKEK